MENENLLAKLGYDGFLNSNNDIESLYPDYKDISKIGADKVYFSGDNPAVLFLEVGSFSDTVLIRIADIQKKAWNYGKILLLFAVSDTEIRIYNCHEKPRYISKENPNIGEELNKIRIFEYNADSDEEVLANLENVFSRIGVDSGLLWSPKSDFHSQISTQRRLDKFLVQSLVNTAKKLEETGVKNKDVIHALLMRSLFILFLEDKGAAREAGLYESIIPGAKSYFSILKDVNATYLLFEEVRRHFNGNVFPVLSEEKDMVKQEHLDLIRKCFIDGDLSDQQQLYGDWRLFDFKIIHIELLSEIYENFLGKFKKERGQFYTPHSLVELILKDKLPSKSKEYNRKVLDPACGSGIFLVESYKRLVQRWKNANANKKIDYETLQTILLENIFGIEIDETAIKVAAFSLYLALIDELDPKTLWIGNDYRLPYLIFDPDDKNITASKQGKNLLRRNTISQVRPEEFIQADLLVGNPPFGAKGLPDEIKEYCQKYSFGSEKVLPFLHKATDFCPYGQIALIFNTKVLTNTEKPFQTFREWLFNQNSVSKIYNLSVFRKVPKTYGGQLFSETITPVSIVYFQNSKPAPEQIEYCSPKTYVKSNLIDGLVIDSTDIKYLPIDECQKGDSKIWNVAMWGSYLDYKLIEKVSNPDTSLESYLKSNSDSWVNGRGVHPEYKKDYIKPPKILYKDSFKKYYTPNSSFDDNSKKFRPIKYKLFGKPFLSVQEFLSDNRICSAFIDSEHVTEYRTHNFSCDNQNALYALNMFFNSNFVHYYLFLTASEWGIKTPRVLLKELKALPSILSASDVVNKLAKLGREIKEIICTPFFDSHHRTISEIEAEASLIISEFFALTEKDKILIADLLDRYKLYINGIKSPLLSNITLPESKAYAKILTEDLNNFMSRSKLVANANVYDVQKFDPLNMVVIEFESEKINIEEKPLASLSSSLKEIDKYLLQEKAQSIYVQKQIRHYEANRIYIIKPNQKRFWTRSQAFEDASSIIEEILSMEASK
jgi:hypothetical protein